MDGAMAGSSASMAASKAARLSWAGPVSRKISVEPHHTITSRSHPFSSRNRRMSARSCSPSSRLFAPRFTFGPSSRFTYAESNTAGIGRTVLRKSATGSMSRSSRTRAWRALS